MYDVLNDEDDHVPNELVELRGITGSNGTYASKGKGVIIFNAKALGKDFNIVKVVLKTKVPIDILAEEGTIKRKIQLVPTGEKDTYEAHIDDNVDILLLFFLREGSAQVEIQSCRSNGKRDNVTMVEWIVRFTTNLLWCHCLYHLSLFDSLWIFVPLYFVTSVPTFLRLQNASRHSRRLNVLAVSPANRSRRARNVLLLVMMIVCRDAAALLTALCLVTASASRRASARASMTEKCTRSVLWFDGRTARRWCAVSTAFTQLTLRIAQVRAGSLIGLFSREH